MAWVTWRQHRAQFVASLGVLGALALAALGTRVPISEAYRHNALADCLPPSARPGLRSHRRPLPGRVRRLGDGRPRSCRPARARRPLHRCSAPGQGAGARHLSIRLDAGDHSAPVAPLEDGATRVRNARRRRPAERPRHVVASAIRHPSGTDGAERLRRRGARRAGLRGLRPHRRRPRGAAPPAHRRGDDRDPRRVRVDPADGAVVPAPGLHGSAVPDGAAHGDRAASRRLGAERHARRRGRQADQRRARRPGDRARTTGERRSAHLPRHARLEARHLLSACRPVLDVPDLRSESLRRALSRGNRRCPLWLVRRTPT